MTRINDPSVAEGGLPVVPLRDLVVFPHSMMPLFVGRKPSVAAVEAAMDAEREIILLTQKEASCEEPGPEDLFQVGTRAYIVQQLRLPDGTMKVLVEGRARVRVSFAAQVDSAAAGNQSPLWAEPIADKVDLRQSEALTIEVEALARSVKESFQTYAKRIQTIEPEMVSALKAIEDVGQVADGVAAHLVITATKKQLLLEIFGVGKRLEAVLDALQAEIEILEAENRIRSRVKRQMDRSQKEYYLTEKMSAIQKELGDQDELKSEIDELENAIRTKALSADARVRLEKEIRKLKMMQPMSAEATVVRSYIDTVLSLPWDTPSDECSDMSVADRVLESDHHGLKKVKERIIEYLAVRSRVERMKGPILCFVGPPGVGKTSLGRSIARATDRKFVRISLGGVRDEAEIRGHRRTYIGALPGKIIQGLKRAGTSNPVFLLDEIDKMASDFRGDPASALLEVLDPEQNQAFNDHYLELDYDLSEVMFLTTANTLDAIPLALRDRMEVIEIAGYSDDEKVSIAKRYLIPKEKENNGIKGLGLTISDAALRRLIQMYTKEAGVRHLQRALASICRKVVRRSLQKPEQQKYSISAGNLAGYLGVEKFSRRSANEGPEVGLANGLAVTAYGGDLLATEVTVVPGKGKLELTGKIGTVMQESAQAALSYIRSRAGSLGLSPDFYQSVDIHLHCPEGAIPKDGPSAGITIASAMVSALLHLPVRHDVAMTGEITLRGRILAIGGLKDKLLAARRAGITTVLIPKENAKDLDDLAELGLRRADISLLDIVPVAHVDEVLGLALHTDSDDDARAFFPSEVLDWRLSPAGPSVAH